MSDEGRSQYEACTPPEIIEPASSKRPVLRQDSVLDLGSRDKWLRDADRRVRLVHANSKEWPGRAAASGRS